MSKKSSEVTLEGIFTLSVLRTRNMKEPLPYIFRFGAPRGERIFFISSKEMKKVVNKNIKNGSKVIFEPFSDAERKFKWARNIDNRPE